MAGGKQSPRDKMIGMMYLVLLALLAMNVTKSVLNSFVVINGAMTETNDAFAQKNDATMAEFSVQNGLNEAKVLPFFNKAKAVHKASKELDEYFENLKKHIISETEGYSPEVLANGTDWITLDTAQALGDIDRPQTILLGSEPMSPKEGDWTMLEMKEKISEWEEKVLAQFPANERASLESIHFVYEDGVNHDGEIEPWHISHFYHAPLAAVITDISMFQNQVKNSESQALGLLMDNITTATYDFDKVEVKVIPKSNYVVLGDSFKAELIVAAYSTTQNPQVVVGAALDTAGKSSKEWAVTNPFDTARVQIKEGIATYGFKPTSEGEKTWGGIVKVPRAGTDDFDFYPFEHTFIAAKPSYVVSPTKMNVMYKSLKNPIDVSVSGFSASDLVISASGGSLSGSNGSYFVTPSNSARKVVVNVSVKTKTGNKVMGTSEFRVKSIPKPTPKFATVVGSGKVSLPQLKAASKVTVELKDFMFDGIKYTVKSFSMVGYVKGKKNTITSKSERISAKQKVLISNQKSKSQIVIKNIWVVGPSGQKELIPGNVIIDVK
jgi:gliding motility-associated protein GldM